MIPRRLYEHIKSHNWFAVAIDFVIVVVGVFIGIQVSNWNAERLEKRAARTYIERIREDIGASAKSVQNLLDYYRAIKSHALAALDGFDKPQDELGEQFLWDAYHASRFINRTVERSTYDEILSAGAMNSIQNLEIRRRLATYYKNVELIEDYMRYVPPYRENLRRFMPYAVQAAIFERCAEDMPVDARGSATFVVRDTCDMALPSGTVNAAIAAIRTPELKLDLVRRLADLDVKLTAGQRLIDRGQALDQFLAEAEI
jgi:hypothetical protein